MGYWENRQAKLMYERMEKAEKVSRDLNTLYRQSSVNLNKRIEKAYNTFKVRHKLTDEQAESLLSKMQDKTSIKELRKRLALDPDNADLLAELESGAYRARIERLESMKTEIENACTEIREQETKRTKSHYTDLAKDTYNREIYEIQRKVGFQFSFSVVDSAAINKLLRQKWNGGNYSSRIWSNTDALADDLKHELMLNLLTGRTLEETVKAINQKYAVGAYKARRLVRTESNYISGQMQKQAYKECDAEKYEFVAVLDLKTSEICRELDGQVFLVKDMTPGVNCNPMHPFCRSTTAIWIDEETRSRMQRRARNPVTGENELIPASMNYKQWYKENVENNPEALTKQKTIKYKTPDQEQYERYRTVLGKNKVGKNLEEFQKIKYDDSTTYGRLKHEYRIVNSYENNSGNMSVDKILELDQKAFDIKNQQFTGKAKKKANIAVMEIDGDFKIGNSQVNSRDDPGYNNFKGEKSQLVLQTDNPKFKTLNVGSHERAMDSEAKLLEYAAQIADDGKKHTIVLLSEKCMCDSCLGVLEQFEQQYPTVKIDVVSNKKERSLKNKNKPWDYRTR